MKVHSERIETAALVAEAGGAVDLRAAAQFFVPQFPTPALPDPATVPGMIAWDVLTSTLVVSDGLAWQTLAVVP